MESPLSFNSSENFRKKLLVRNLKPYTVDGVFNAPKLENKQESIFVDYAVKDSPKIDNEQKNQEKKLITKNKYNPNDGFGNVVSINIDLNYETNFGNYGYQSSLNSKLEQIGEKNEKLLYVQNLYGPIDFSSSYGNTVQINQNTNTNTNLGVYGLRQTFGSKLETFGVQKEIELIVQNQYKSDDESIATVNINNNLQTKNGGGQYGYKNTLQSLLQNNGVVKKNELIVQNQYTPENNQSVLTVDINKNLQTNANEGNYGFGDSINSPLELLGDIKENELRVLNKYTPNNQPNGYGNSVLFPFLTIGSNEGSYQYVSNGITLTTEQSQTQQYVLNIFGPSGGYQGEYNFILSQTRSNQGEYSFTASNPPRTTEQSQIVAYVANQYGPENQPNGFGNIKNPNTNNQTKTNEGEYEFTASRPPQTTEQSQQFGYQKNKFNSGEGQFEVTTIDELFPSNLNEPYYNSDTTFYFQPSFYNPISILTEDNPAGSEGSLSQDSDLAKLGAKQLQKEFKTRVALELYQQTLGRSILTNTSVSSISGEISSKPSFDPFDILGVVTNNVPLIQKNYKITSPSNVAVETLGFAARLSGLYSPYSLIPGEYFNYPNRNFINQVTTNPIGGLVSGVGGLLNTLVTPFIDSGSERFLQNTSDATKSLLFEQVFYNTFRPDYRFATPDNNLSAPNANFYVGKNKNFVRDVVSPANEIADGAYGKKNVGPVFDYGSIGQEYEGNDVQRKLFGLKSYSYFDGKGGLQGGFTWVSKSNNYIKPGQFVGPQNQTYATSESSFDATLRKQFNDTNSSKINLTDGSILDITQKLVDAGAKSSNPKGHVGNAINQVSKVFNDGYIELTKGSRVRRYLTPNAVQGTTKVKDIVGYEYARLFSKDRPFSTFDQLQKKDGNIRKSSYSILDNTYNLNIAPMKSASGVESTNLTAEGKVKKYMLSIENLAWRTSNRPGFTVDELPACEIGPNGGRIMWFPPYELSFDDTTRTDWEENTFLGRTEPVYTFKNASRSGSLKFKIIVDHPSILNVIVKKELERADESLATQVVDSFIAGCLKYDVYDLLKKYKQFNLSDVYSVISALNPDALKTVTNNLPNSTITNEVTETVNANISNQSTGANQQTTSTETINIEKFQQIQLLFDISEPATTYQENYNILIGSELNYTTQASDKIYKYDGTESNETNINLSDYVDDRKSSIQGVFEFLKSENNTFTEMLSNVLKSLDSGNKVVISIEGSSNSGEGTPGYGLKRSESIKSSIESFEEGGIKMSKFLESNPPLLTINTTDIGNPTINEDNYRNIDCSKAFPNNLIYQNSVQGLMCRAGKVSLTSVTPPNGNEGQPLSDIVPEGDLANPLAADNNNVDNTQTQLLSNPNVKKSKNQDKTNGIRDGLTKRLLRKLLTECDYFEMIAEQNPMLYDGIKSKLKYFHPLFHSITPEGLNSRLTFLQQCMRPGDTIPTAVETNEGGIGLQYNDVLNSAFGSPPVCILRVGDFYHTKVVFDNLDLKYDDIPFDLNPEGIGVQPMLADVTLGFKMIGGHGLKEPIATLQNALSFNYYANTEMYDERAEETEPFTAKYDQELLDIIKNEIGNIGPQQRPAVNDGGATIGIIENTFIDPQINGVSGTIRYKEVMDELVVKTEEYVNNINSTFEQLKNDLLWGGLVIYTSERKFSNGYFAYLTGNSANQVTIFGKPITYQDKVNTIFNKAKEDVDNDISPILGGITQEPFLSNEIRKVKRKLNKMIDDKKTPFLQSLETNTSKIVQSQIDMIKYIDQITYVLSSVDGYKNKSGGVTIYNISGTSGVNSSSFGPPADTFVEMENDFITVGNNLNTLNNKFQEYNIIPSGSTKYNDSLDFDLFLGTLAPQDNVFFMIFGKDILEENGVKTFVEELLNEIPTDAPTRGSWTLFLYRNLGFDASVMVEDFPTTEFSDSRYKYYVNSKKVLEDNYKKFKDEYFNISFPNGKYSPFVKGKTRLFDLSSQIPVLPPNDANLLDLWSTQDSPGEDFNLKKKMN
jgi:hypothetical protein